MTASFLSLRAMSGSSSPAFFNRTIDLRAASSASAWRAAFGDALGRVGSTKGCSNRPSQELGAQHAGGRRDRRHFGDAAALDHRDERGEAIRLRQLDVDAGRQRQARRVGLVARHVMAR